MTLLALPKALEDSQPFEDIYCSKTSSMYIGPLLMLVRFRAKVQKDVTCLSKLFKMINLSNC